MPISPAGRMRLFTSLFLITASLHAGSPRATLLQEIHSPSFDTAADALEEFNKEPSDAPAEIAALERILDTPMDPFPAQRLQALAYEGLLLRGKAGEDILMKRATDKKRDYFTRMSAVTALRSYYPNLLRPEIDTIAEELLRDAEPLRNPSGEKESRLQDGGFEQSQWREDWTFHQQDEGRGSALPWSEHTRSGQQSLLLRKTNSRGVVFLRSRQPITVPANKQVAVRLYFKALDAPPDATLRLLFEDENGSLSFGDMNRGHSALAQTLLYNTAQGEWTKRVALTNAAPNERRLYLRVVLSGNASRVAIDDVSFPGEDYRYRSVNSMTTVPSAAEPFIEDEKINHEAWVEKIDGRARLLVDGKVTPPVLYANVNSLAQTDYAEHEGMAKMAGVKLQTVHVPLADYVFRFPGRKNIVTWRTGGLFDFTLGHRNMRHFARSSKDALAVLNFHVGWPEDWVLKNPEEAWVNHEGERAYGTDIHVRGFAKELPPGHRWIPSPFSKKALAEAEAGIARFIREIKQDGHDRRVVGCHLAGGHDGQFYTGRWADYSPAAKTAFREWLTARYGSSEALAKAWNQPGVTLETVELPEWIEESKDGYFLSPSKHQPIIDHRQFTNEQGTRIMEGFARTVKESLGKRVFALAWSMGGNFGGTNGDELFSAFLTSESLDGIVAQPSYELRLPGLYGGFVSAFESFHAHGKLLIKELDLRTWLRPGSPETRTQGLGATMTLPMFEDSHRKEAGEMIAADHGYWFFDIGLTHFRDPGMLREIGKGVALYRQLLEKKEAAPLPRREVALVYGTDNRYWRADFPIASRSVQSRLERYTDISLRSAGVPFETWYLDDFLSTANLDSIKIVIFFNIARLTDEQRAAIQRRVAGNNRVLIWNDSPGYINASPAPGNITSLTGIQISHDLITKLPFIRAAASDHPYALPEDVTLGMGEPSWLMTQLGLENRDLKTSFDRFSIDDKDARILARYDDGKAAVAVKDLGSWTSVYFAFPGSFDGALLRRIADSKQIWAPGGYGFPSALNAHFASLYAQKAQKNGLDFPKGVLIRDALTGEALTPASIKADAATSHWLIMNPAQ